MTAFQEFKNLHEQNSLLHIANVWDANSVLLFEKAGYKSIGTSSSAIAESLGYEDGEEMSFDALFSVVDVIKKRTSLPLTVDLEAGYSRDPDDILKNIIMLSEIGVVGINLEDSTVENGNRNISDSAKFSKLIQFLKNSLAEKGIDVFFNIRTDFFLMGLDNPLNETIARAMLYEAAGADGIFVPCVTDENDIQKIVDSVSLPVNVMAMPNLPSFLTLQNIGVKRVSMGPFFYNMMNDYFNKITASIEEAQAFTPIFSNNE